MCECIISKFLVAVVDFASTSTSFFSFFSLNYYNVFNRKQNEIKHANWLTKRYYCRGKDNKLLCGCAFNFVFQFQNKRVWNFFVDLIVLLGRPGWYDWQYPLRVCHQAHWSLFEYDLCKFRKKQFSWSEFTSTLDLMKLNEADAKKLTRSSLSITLQIAWK